MSSDFPFFRITVLGAEKSGKTCLVNSFVNNFCPLNYIPTEVPQLYYRTVRMESLDDDADDFTTALVEIEDWTSQGQSEMVEDFLSRNSLSESRPHEADPLSERDAPEYLHPDNYLDKYKPLTHRRMGYIIVFDVTVEQSYRDAKDILQHVALSIDEGMRRDKTHSKPVVYLVANKVDKDPIGFDYQQRLQDAKNYAIKKRPQEDKRMNLKFFECSALEFKNVRRVFLEMLDDIGQERGLWVLNYSEKKDSEQSEKNTQDGFFGFNLGGIGNFGGLLGFGRRP
mmetsp:Transcript_11761/g.21407  ORF Transcript_11761/g.21407 Transcript_11761/m.21407 type:complete len:283 (-) Transcript_11761:66-914(-)